jgi:hypothetical protein
MKKLHIAITASAALLVVTALNAQVRTTIASAVNGAGVLITPMLKFGGVTSSFPALKMGGATWIDARLADDSGYASFNAGDLSNVSNRVTQGGATGVTVGTFGSIVRQYTKVTVSTAAFTCAALTCDVTLWTVPNTTFVAMVYANLTQTFACTATCTTSTLSLLVGKGGGGAQYLASFDADAATGWFGDADAELGTSLARAAAVQGGVFEPTGVGTLQIRLTSGTGNIGTGAATNLSQGSVVVYLFTERLQ